MLIRRVSAGSTGTMTHSSDQFPFLIRRPGEGGIEAVAILVSSLFEDFTPVSGRLRVTEDVRFIRALKANSSIRRAEHSRSRFRGRGLTYLSSLSFACSNVGADANDSLSAERSGFLMSSELAIRRAKED
jgi:hypothetical protein